MSTFADKAFEFYHAKEDFEERLQELIENDFGRIGWDDYDTSLEIYEVEPSVRLSEAAQQFIFDSGFRKVYVNHTDGSETNYNWGYDKAFKANDGWRRVKNEDGSLAAETNSPVIKWLMGIIGVK